MTDAWDVIVVGAGPAGAIAAREVAGGGLRVLIVDASCPAAHKVGEALPAAASRLLRKIKLEILATSGAHTRIGGTWSCWGSDALIAAESLKDPEGGGWRLDRQRFDEDLRMSAELAGVERLWQRVRAVRRDTDTWRVQLDGGEELKARWLIDASGRAACIARRVGARRRRDRRLIALYAIGARPVSQFVDRTLVEAVAEGWWYAAILPSGVPCVGFHGDARQVARLASVPAEWSRALLRTRHVASLFGSAQFSCQLPPLEACGARLDRFAGKEWIACGDAALSFDPVSGQGLLSALHSGMSAGRAIVDAMSGRQSTVTTYCERLEQIREIYRDREQRVYRAERRWPSQPFWAQLV